MCKIEKFKNLHLFGGREVSVVKKWRMRRIWEHGVRIFISFGNAASTSTKLSNMHCNKGISIYNICWAIAHSFSVTPSAKKRQDKWSPNANPQKATIKIAQHQKLEEHHNAWSHTEGQGEVSIGTDVHLDDTGPAASWCPNCKHPACEEQRSRPATPPLDTSLVTWPMIYIGCRTYPLSIFLQLRRAGQGSDKRFSYSSFGFSYYPLDIFKLIHPSLESQVWVDKSSETCVCWELITGSFLSRNVWP